MERYKDSIIVVSSLFSFPELTLNVIIGLWIDMSASAGHQFLFDYPYKMYWLDYKQFF